MESDQANTGSDSLTNCDFWGKVGNERQLMRHCIVVQQMTTPFLTILWLNAEVQDKELFKRQDNIVQ